jgi:hypothetical protein
MPMAGKLSTDTIFSPVQSLTWSLLLATVDVENLQYEGVVVCWIACSYWRLKLQGSKGCTQIEGSLPYVRKSQSAEIDSLLTSLLKTLGLC